MNEGGLVAGTSGICGNVSVSSALHAVLWRNRIPRDLGSLGGTTGNVALGINNLGQVVGVSDLPGDATFHGFLWQNGLITDLGTLPGDFFSAATAVNHKGQVTAESCDINFNCRAAIWQEGVMTDLNTLIPAGSSLFLLIANSINSRGQIVGAAFDENTGAVVPFLATPCDDKADREICADSAQGATAVAGETGEHPKIALPETVRKLFQQRRGLGRFGFGLKKQQ
jgi:probable HAF family extracellular repeat protein